MNQEIEIEFKNLLTIEEFLNLTKKFSIYNDHFKTQVNYYFDTLNFALKAKDSALRIRFKEQRYILTLKQTIEYGILETHQALSDNEAQLMLKNEHFPSGDIKDILIKENIAIKEIIYFGSLTTNRAETAYKNGVLVFDHSKYLSHEDYELEYEVKNRKQGQAHFLNLLETYQIPIRKTENKIQRLFKLISKE